MLVQGNRLIQHHQWTKSWIYLLQCVCVTSCSCFAIYFWADWLGGCGWKQEMVVAHLSHPLFPLLPMNPSIKKRDKMCPPQLSSAPKVQISAPIISDVKTVSSRRFKGERNQLNWVRVAQHLKLAKYRPNQLQWHRLPWHSVEPSGYSDTFLMPEFPNL